MKKLLFIILSLILVLIPVSSVFAINPPTSVTITSVNAYQNIIESGDQFYLVAGAINYTTYPTDYNANESYSLRLLDASSNEITTAGLFANPYFHTGYGMFLASFYFPASDVTTYSINWSSDYHVELLPNPVISWNGTASSAISPDIVWSGTGQSTRILYLMAQLQANWGVSLIDAGTLTLVGENYIVSVIPYARYIAPTIFASYTTTPTFHERTTTSWFTYAVTLRNQWVGTWFDLTNLATVTNIPAIWWYAFIWLIVMAGIIFLMIEAPSLISNNGVVFPTAKNTKMIFYLVILLVFFGGLIGFLPYIASYLIGFILVLMIMNQLFFSKSTG